MSEENVEIVKRMYGVFDSGDWQRASELADPEIEFDVSRTNPEGRVYRGMEGFEELMSQWLGPWEDYSLELLELIDAGDTNVVAVTREKGKIKGSDAWIQHVRGVLLTLRDGRITRYEEHQDRETALEAAGLSE
jgi:ketosteroid isomerase-like protein